MLKEFMYVVPERLHWDGGSDIVVYWLKLYSD